MEKLKLSEELKEEIINKFNSGVSMRELERLYPYSFFYIQKLITSHTFNIMCEKNYPTKEGYEIIAICKTTKKEFKDYSNTSGTITTHIFNLFPEESSKSKYIRKSEEYKTNKFWYDKYFDFIYRVPELIETKKCFYCDWTTTDINNLSGAYEKHLLTMHNLTVDKYLINNSTDKSYFKCLPAEDALTCMICGEKLSIINHKHLIKHNISVEEYREKFNTLMVSKSANEKLSISAKITNRYAIKSYISKSENEIKEFLLSYNIKVIQSDRKILNGLEIDLYCPDYKIGIEYNGNLYHSENYGKKDINYHLNKSNIALESGVKLYHIHDDEWDYNKDLIKSKLLHIFNIKEDITLFDDNCIIIDNTIFLDRRWFPLHDNNYYINLGYKYIETLPPDYLYYKLSSHCSLRLARDNFTKEIIKIKYPNVYDDNKTEWQMMQELKYDRIWDCGKFKYVLPPIKKELN